MPVDCGQGLYFSTTFGLCTVLPFQCTSIDPLMQKCLGCNGGYVLDPLGVCVRPCPLGQTLIGSNCFLHPPDCTGLNLFLQCTGCSGNRRLQAGQCVLCNGPNPNFPCVTCPSDQFVSSQGRCIRAQPNCQAVDQATGFCLSCTSGAFPTNGVCPNNPTSS